MLIQLWFYSTISITGWIIGRVITRNNKYLKPVTKFIGLTILVVPTWIISYLLYKIWPKGLYFHWEFITWGVVFTSFIIWFAKDKNKKQFLYSILKYELGGIVIFFLLNYIRLFKPDLSGTERPMDLSFIYNFTKQPAPPFENPWLTGAVLNYYYLGQFLISIFVKLTFLPVPTVYTFSIAYIATLIFQSYKIAFQYIAKIPSKYSQLFAIVLTFGGNFYGLSRIIAALYDSLKQLTYVIHLPHYYFPDATRVIPFTINEFPSYSIAIGDLHGHFIALPFFITSLYLLYLIYLKINNPHYKIAWTIPILGIFTFFLFATNSWDVLTLTELIIILGVITLPKSLKFIIKNARFITFSLTLTLALYLSFKRFFIPPINGIGFTIAHDYKYWFALWGHIFIFLIICILNCKKILNKKAYVYLLFLLAIGFANLIIVNFIYLKDIFSALNSDYSRANTVFKIYYQLWSLLGISTIALAYKSISLIKDLKLEKSIRLLFSIVLAIMLSYPIKIVVDYFPITWTNIKNYTPVFFNSRKLNTFICKLNFFEPQYKLDRKLLEILKKKTKGKKPITIAEAITDKSYSLYGRMFVFSGNRSITGWPFHNAQWYNGIKFSYYWYDLYNYKATHNLKFDNIYQRLQDAQTIYQATITLDKLNELINKYAIGYIIIGQLERELFTENNLNKAKYVIQQACPQIFNINNKYYIFKCKYAK